MDKQLTKSNDFSEEYIHSLYQQIVSDGQLPRELVTLFQNPKEEALWEPFSRILRKEYHVLDNRNIQVLRFVLDGDFKGIVTKTSFIRFWSWFSPIVPDEDPYETSPTEETTQSFDIPAPPTGIANASTTAATTTTSTIASISTTMATTTATTTAAAAAAAAATTSSTRNSLTSTTATSPECDSNDRGSIDAYVNTNSHHPTTILSMESSRLSVTNVDSDDDKRDSWPIKPKSTEVLLKSAVLQSFVQKQQRISSSPTTTTTTTTTTTKTLSRQQPQQLQQQQPHQHQQHQQQQQQQQQLSPTHNLQHHAVRHHHEIPPPPPSHAPIQKAWQISDISSHILHKAWFHGFVNVTQARERLQHEKAGTFLVRFSGECPHFTLDLQDGQRVRHWRIEWIGRESVYRLFKDDFLSLQDFIDHYKLVPMRLASGQSAPLLKDGLPRKQWDSSFM